MIQLLSNIAFSLFAIAYFPIFLTKLKQADDPKRLWRERLGNLNPQLFSSDVPPPNTKRPFRIWVHAVSVGEVKAIEPFLKFLEKESFQVFLSTVTPTGQKEAHKLTKNAFYFPFDLTFAVQKSLTTIAPDLILLVETELWPNFILEAAKRNIPVGVVNGRLSKRSFERYLWIKPLLVDILKKVSFFMMQTPADGERLKLLGAEPAKVEILGNMKFDASRTLPTGDPVQLKTAYGISKNKKVWVAGSTHPGEERKVLAVFTRLRSLFSDLVLVIAPRHIERAQAVESLVRDFNFQPVLFTHLQEAKKNFDVLILDTIGELKKVYSFSDVVWLGGSFIPHGGQNPIEPALFSKPILSGPLVANFEFVYSELERNSAAIIVPIEDELFIRLKEFLTDPEKARRYGANAKEVVDKLSGASLRTAKRIKSFLGNS